MRYTLLAVLAFLVAPPCMAQEPHSQTTDASTLTPAPHATPVNADQRCVDFVANTGFPDLPAATECGALFDEAGMTGEAAKAWRAAFVILDTTKDDASLRERYATLKRQYNELRARNATLAAAIGAVPPPMQPGWQPAPPPQPGFWRRFAGGFSSGLANYYRMQPTTNRIKCEASSSRSGYNSTSTWIECH